MRVATLRVACAALLSLSATGCSSLTAVQAGPLLGTRRQPGLDGLGVDVHVMGGGRWSEGGMVWVDSGVQGKVTERLQQLGAEEGLGASFAIQSVFLYGRGDLRLSVERFDATPFAVPGALVELGVAVALTDRVDTPRPFQGLCGSSEQRRHRVMLTFGPSADYSAHVTRPGEGFVGVSLGVAWLDAYLGPPPGCHTIGAKRPQEHDAALVPTAGR